MNRALNTYQNATLWWLRGEDTYQFDKNKVTHRANPQSSFAYIWNEEIANKIHRFQQFAECADGIGGQIQLQAAQQVLKACGAARGAAVWKRVTRGATVERSSDATWLPLVVRLASADRVPELAELEVGRESPDLETVDELLGGLAVFTCAYMASNELKVVPLPGVPSGEIIPVDLASIPVVTRLPGE